MRQSDKFTWQYLMHITAANTEHTLDACTVHLQLQAHVSKQSANGLQSTWALANCRTGDTMHRSADTVAAFVPVAGRSRLAVQTGPLALQRMHYKCITRLPVCSNPDISRTAYRSGLSEHRY